MFSKKTFILIGLIISICMIGAFQIFANQQPVTQNPKIIETNIEVLGCPCGTTCVVDPGGVCTKCSEWDIGLTNAPCEIEVE